MNRKLIDKMRSGLAIPLAFWTALAKRSGDSAFARTQTMGLSKQLRPNESGDKRSATPQSKTVLLKSITVCFRRVSFRLCQPSN